MSTHITYTKEIFNQHLIMQDRRESQKWSEDELLTEEYSKYETSGSVNGHVHQSVNNLFIISRIVLKGATIGDTKNNMTIKKKRRQYDSGCKKEKMRTQCSS